MSEEQGRRIHADPVADESYWASLFQMEDAFRQDAVSEYLEPSPLAPPEREPGSDATGNGQHNAPVAFTPRASTDPWQLAQEFMDGDRPLQLKVIGHGRPVGLCGSGVLDALAAFVGAGWVDARGRIAPGGPRAGVVDGVRTITLADESADMPAIRFSQHDVRAVQLAKSAIRTGVALLAAEAGMHEDAIDRVVIAGAFGAYIDVASAVVIGLLPPLPRERFTQVGNAAGLGIQQMLASTERRRRAAGLAVECRCIELSLHRDFQRTFLNHIGFAP